MPVADYETYCRMLDVAREKRFAYPAIAASDLRAVGTTLFASSASSGA
jgi:fructose-bisphosphate aldolase, class II